MNPKSNFGIRLQRPQLLEQSSRCAAHIYKLGGGNQLVQAAVVGIRVAKELGKQFKFFARAQRSVVTEHIDVAALKLGIAHLARQIPLEQVGIRLEVMALMTRGYGFFWLEVAGWHIPFKNRGHHFGGDVPVIHIKNRLAFFEQHKLWRVMGNSCQSRHMIAGGAVFDHSDQAHGQFTVTHQPLEDTETLRGFVAGSRFKNSAEGVFGNKGIDIFGGVQGIEAHGK